MLETGPLRVLRSTHVLLTVPRSGFGSALKEESMTAARVLVLAVLVMAGASGCAMFNKGTLQYSRTFTIGKELVDLKDAMDKGALTQDEYAKAKKDILEGGPIKFEATCSAKE